MPVVPETRHSLILRLRDAQDVVAWDEFLEIYQPLVYGLARKRGLQHADAEEIVQEVMVAVSRAVGAWLAGPQRGRFRIWLFTIARNLTVNWLTRSPSRTVGTGDTGMIKLSEAHCAPSSEQTAQFDLEYRRQVFRWASERVRTQVKEQTWEAFWISSVEGVPIEAVAERLGLSVGSVYVARSRIAARLRKEAQRFDSIEASSAVSRTSSD